MGFEVLRDSGLFVYGLKASRLRISAGFGGETVILTEVDTYWIVLLPMSDGIRAYNRYFGRVNMGKIKMLGVTARNSPFRNTSGQERLLLRDMGVRGRSGENVLITVDDCLRIGKSFLESERNMDRLDQAMGTIGSRSPKAIKR